MHGNSIVPSEMLAIRVDEGGEPLKEGDALAIARVISEAPVSNFPLAVAGL